MQIRPDRFRLLVRSIADSPLGIAALAQLADVSKGTLAPGYSQTLKQSTMLRVAAAAAELLHLDKSPGDELPAQLAAWLMGHAEPTISKFLAELPELRQCVKCKHWFDGRKKPGKPPEFIPETGCCRQCHRDQDRQLKAAKSPRQVQIRAELRAQLPRLTERDPELAAAVVAALDSPEAVTMPRIAARLGDAPPRSVAARLRRSIVTLALLRMLAGGGTADATPMSRTNVPVRRDGTRRRPLTLGSGSPPPTPRRRRKGAQSAAGGRYYSTGEARV